MTENHPAPLQIDLKAILAARCGGKCPLPAPIVRWLAARIKQQQLNKILSSVFPLAGSAFAGAVLRYLNITLEVKGLDEIPDGHRYLFASNHPLGGLDGIALIAVLGAKYGDDGFRFPVNDMLMNVRPLEHIFVPINKYGAQGRDAAVRLNAEYASSRQMAIFPAGLVSRIQPGGEVADLRWHKHFVIKARESGRMIVPVKIEALNSMSFYRTALWRKRLGLKFNFEQILLPSELVKSQGMKIVIKFGKPMDLLTLPVSAPGLQATLIKEMAYAL